MRSFLGVFFIFATTAAVAYSDSDLDGVEDGMDRCQNTPFTQLVNKDGCPLSQSNLNYEILLNTEYSQIDYATAKKGGTVTTSLDANVYYKDWSFGSSVAHYKTDADTGNKSGADDTILSVSHSYGNGGFGISPGFSVALPTYKTGYNNEGADYTVSAAWSLELERGYMFGGAGYTWVTDKDAGDISYQNGKFYNLGFGFEPTANSLLSIGFYFADSIYKGATPIQTIKAGYSYRLNEGWYTSMRYGYGVSVSSSDHSFALGIGYTF